MGEHLVALSKVNLMEFCLWKKCPTPQCPVFSELSHNYMIGKAIWGNEAIDIGSTEGTILKPRMESVISQLEEFPWIYI